MNKITLDDEGKDYLIWREGSGDTIEIYDLLVVSNRRMGIGRNLVNKLLVVVSLLPESPHLVFAFTRPSNRISQEFYEGIGFKQYVVIPMFYENHNSPGKREAAIVWGWAL